MWAKLKSVFKFGDIVNSSEHLHFILIKKQRDYNESELHRIQNHLGKFHFFSQKNACRILINDTVNLYKELLQKGF